MSSLKKIMVPLAFSHFSSGMLSYTADLAKGLDAELLLVNVINDRDVEAVQRIASYGYHVDEEHYTKGIQKGSIQKYTKGVKSALDSCGIKCYRLSYGASTQNRVYWRLVPCNEPGKKGRKNIS